MTMPPYDWTKHRAELKKAAKECKKERREVPLQQSTLPEPNVGDDTRASVNGLVLRRLQRMASDRWSRPAIEASACRQGSAPGGRSTPRRCVSNEEQVFSRLELLRQGSDESSNSQRRRKLHKTKSAMQVVNRTAGQAPKQDAPGRRIPRKSTSSSAPRASDVEPTRSSLRRTASSSTKRTKNHHKSAAPKQPQRALSPIPRKKNIVTPIAA